MGSKYDKFWEGKINDIKNKIEEALKIGRSNEIDVSNILRYGKRNNWSTWVTITPGITKITEEFSPDAHGKSLGNIIICSGILNKVEKVITGRISKRGTGLFLHFEIGEKKYDRSSKKMKKMNQSYTSHTVQYPDHEYKIGSIYTPLKPDYTRAATALKNIEPQSPFIYGKWKNMAESNIKKIAILRICSPQTKVAKLRSLEFSLDINKLLNIKIEEEILDILRKYGIRFPPTKTNRIIQLQLINMMNLILSIEELSGVSLNQERKSRKRVISEIKGMGLKTASDFLKDIGFSKYLAVLDSRNLRFLQNFGLAPKNLKANKLNRQKLYFNLEDVENELAKKMEITVSEVDEKIMAYTGDEGPHKNFMNFM